MSDIPGMSAQTLTADGSDKTSVLFLELTHSHTHTHAHTLTQTHTHTHTHRGKIMRKIPCIRVSLHVITQTFSSLKGTYPMVPPTRLFLQSLSDSLITRSMGPWLPLTSRGPRGHGSALQDQTHTHNLSKGPRDPHVGQGPPVVLLHADEYLKDCKRGCRVVRFFDHPMNHHFCVRESGHF